MFGDFCIALFFMLFCLYGKSQNTFMGSIEYGNRSLNQCDFQTSTVGDKLYIMSEWVSLEANIKNSELRIIDQHFGLKLKIDNETLFLLRNPFGLYKPTEEGLTLIHSLGGEDNFPYSYVSCNAGNKAFSRYRNTEL